MNKEQVKGLQTRIELPEVSRQVRECVGRF